MLRVAIGFFVFGILAMLLGANNVAGLSMEMGRMILGVFVILAVLSLVVSLISGRKPRLLP